MPLSGSQRSVDTIYDIAFDDAVQWPLQEYQLLTGGFSSLERYPIRSRLFLEMA